LAWIRRETREEFAANLLDIRDGAGSYRRSRIEDRMPRQMRSCPSPFEWALGKSPELSGI
jgi:hypothetical protein